MTRLRLCRVDLPTANAFVCETHRHHGKAQGYRFALGAMSHFSPSNEGAKSYMPRLRGVVICGRPVGGQHQESWIEVTRLCTDGSRNTCSFLYGAAARAAAALGYQRIQTFILDSESGVSLRAAGWTFERLSHPSGWHHDGPRAARIVPEHLRGRKQLWFRELGNAQPLIAEPEPESSSQLQLWEHA